MAASVVTSTVRRFRSMARSKAAMSMPSTAAGPGCPTWFHTKSRPLKCPTVSHTMRRASSSLVRLATMPCAVPPAAAISATTRCTPAASTSTTATCAPSFANLSAPALPMPEAAAVTIPIFPLRRIDPPLDPGVRVRFYTARGPRETAARMLDTTPGHRLSGKAMPTADEKTLTLDAVIVGAGFAGLYMLYRLRGLGLTARVFEAGKGVGGTWYWNRYPGARCDVESMDYSYSFSDELQQEWRWTERYSSQPEILKYINHVADRFDLRRDITLETRVTSAVFDEATSRWTVRTDRGHDVSARFCIMATGCLSTTQQPTFKGLESFKGTWYHTGHWPHEGVDFTGQRVAVIGTGSSAIQSIPIIAAQAVQLFVFQRTPNFSVPAHNAPLDPGHERAVKANYAEFRRQARESRVGFVVERNDASALEVSDEERTREYEARWKRGGLGFSSTFNDVLISKAAN